MTSPIAARAPLASRSAHHAGQTALGCFRNRVSLEVETKNGPLDPVSVADRAVEEMIRAEIVRALPDDAILGEEGGAGAGTSGLRWVIDPIDGKWRPKSLADSRSHRRSCRLPSGDEARRGAGSTEARLLVPD